jgi:hypothetical protein
LSIEISLLNKSRTRNLQIALMNVLFYDIIATKNKEALNTSLKNKLLMKINISIMLML